MHSSRAVHQAFLVSFGITLVAVVVAFLRPSHSPRDEHENLSSGQPAAA